MKERNNIPKATIERLPLYYRCLDKLSTFEEVEVVSSKDLGGRLGIPSTQVRKDLSYYGEFGRRGVGYNVQELKRSVGKILGVDKLWPAVIVGAGNLGRALVNYGSFEMMGLEIVEVFDNDLSKIGNQINGIEVKSIQSIKETLQGRDIKLGIISVPADSAQEVADEMIAAGIKAIWNFAPTRLYIPENIVVRNEDLAVGIVSLIYHLSWQEEMDV
ncbi:MULTISPECIES: redox-sensing transcriptional repressor Rex [unclassified Halanaerobium]|uniref:redox-sensing transcriptional repressor Rex n=1 Tax=unclassified Halanaerobium TaxID=2641197 RepID=UPI000DF11149|nr:MULTISPECIES: redox-sensing transcriptional repressor Rex [unclassified Halanaerobium]RCW50709.1 redox-sensing transcriptional repressor [Halanaerobium sp. MA284_MarDTE_T2]RCW86877.1 redox-sensing transcriptional repressor [Halanaerobium sp. DL-01]